MNKKTYKVIKGYSELDVDARKAVRKFIDEFEKEQFSQRPKLVKALSESVGPLGEDGCPCCGK